MEQRTENNLVEVEENLEKRITLKDILEYSIQKEEPKKTGKGSYERKARGIYNKHKLEKKISVKHIFEFENRIAKNKGQQEKLLNGPQIISVQYIFDKKTVKIKSEITNIFTSWDEYFNKSNDELWIDILNRECLFIRNALKFLYEQRVSQSEKLYIASHINHTDLNEKNKFINSSVKHFKGLLLSGNYKNFLSRNKISQAIDRQLVHEIVKYSLKINIETLKVNENPISKIPFQEFGDRLREHFPELYSAYICASTCTDEINPLVLIMFLEKKYPVFGTFRTLYSSEIWYFSTIYFPLIKRNIKSYHFYPVTMIDYINGDFKDNFINTFLNDRNKVEMIIKDIDKLFDNGENIII